MKIEDLKPNPENPRTIKNEKIEMLKKALDEFGDLGGVVFNRRTQQLVGGHQRAKVIHKKSKVIIESTYENPTKSGTVAEGYIDVDGEKFRYREVDWDQTKETAANLAANKGAGEWDEDKLKGWMTDLRAIDFETDLTMFSQAEIDKLLDLEPPELPDENFDMPEEFLIVLECESESEQQMFYDEFQSRGLKCKIM